MGKAVLINGDFTFTANGQEIYNHDIQVNCSCIGVLYVYCKKSEIKNGSIFTNHCPNLYEASMLIKSEIKSITVTHEPINSDELIARELMKQNNIEYFVDTHLTF